MKKILKIFLILIIILHTQKLYASESNINTEEIIKEQEQELRNIRIHK